MLSSRHFDEFRSPKKTWEELVADKTVRKCKTCGKDIWSYWHIDCWPTVNKKARYDHMEYCGPCLPEELW